LHSIDYARISSRHSRRSISRYSRISHAHFDDDTISIAQKRKSILPKIGVDR